MVIIILTERQKELVQLLKQQSDFQTVDYFARKLGVSKRTVHSELTTIEKYNQLTGESLEKKRGVGIIFRPSNEQIRESEDKEQNEAYTTIDRRIQIMALLLFEEKKVSFNFLSELFLVSKTSIIRDFEFIMPILQEGSTIQLVSDAQGTYLIADEENVQKACLQFSRYVLSNSDYYFEENFTEKIKILEPYYGESVISVCSNILYIYIRENVNAISDYYVENILTIFIILVYRIQKNKHINSQKKADDVVQDLFFEESAVQMMHKAALRLAFSYTNEDVQYLSQHLVSNRFEPLPDYEIDNKLVNLLLTKASEALAIDFSKDKKLEEQLKNHIPPMIFRLRSNNKTENPFTTQIKNEFSLTFNVIWVVLGEYEHELGINFNEDEMAFLTMYFQAAVERARMNRKILVVCQMGIATSELLINRIKNVLPSLDSLEVASVPELEFMQLEQYDLIISTINVVIPGKKVVVVSPFLTDKDIARIRSSGYRPSKLSQLSTLSNGYHLRKFVQPAFIYLDTEYASKEILITKIGNKLVHNQYVQAAFVASVLEREELGGTDLPSGTAVPHGNSCYVNHTVIVIIRNKRKIRWNKYSVDLIFLICIAKQDISQTRNILSDIYNVIDNSRQLKKLRSATSKESLYRDLGSEEDEGK